MADQRNLINVIAKVCEYVLDVENTIADNEMWQWFENNKNHPDSGDCITTFNALMCNESSFEGWESFCQVFGPIYHAENPGKCANVDEAESLVGDEVNEYYTAKNDCDIQWDNLSNLLTYFKNGDDLSMAEILKDIRSDEDECYAYYWDESDFTDRDTNGAIKIVEKLAAIGWSRINENTPELKILARWSKGENLVYLKLEC